ncbi:MAG: DinB family protein [Ginsengibacter sp.]
MNEKNNQGAVNALLAVYEKAIIELQTVIEDIAITDLTAVVDNLTTNSDCRSIQTILTHVVSAGYSYCIYIRNSKNKNDQRPEKADRLSIVEYKNDLYQVFKFSCDTLADIHDHELEEPDDAKKIKTSWGKSYDIEQIMEHAIVHVLRHRRQIERFKNLLITNRD